MFTGADRVSESPEQAARQKAGAITSTSLPNRQVQLGLRLVF
jgi:hypothetical protein